MFWGYFQFGSIWTDHFQGDDLGLCLKVTHTHTHGRTHTHAQSLSKTTKCRYFHFRHLMKILVVIWTYHRSDFSLFWLIFTYFHLFSLIFLGSDLIIDDVFFFYTFFEISRQCFFLWNKWYVLSFFQERYAVRKGHFL